jgi:pimeloyl-ACP methyl ester carboxylesterase
MTDMKASGDRPSPRAQHTYVDVGCHRLRVDISGSGPPLLLVMGLGGNLEMWQPLRDALPHRELITFDNPGTGGSSTPRLPLSIPQHASIASRLLQTLGYGAVDVLGVSWGGVVAQQLAIARARQVRRLVLASTVAGATGWPGRPSVLRHMMTPRRYYSRSYFEEVAPTIYGGRARRDPAYLHGEAQSRLARPPSWRGYFGQVLAISTFTTAPLLHRIQAPTLVGGHLVLFDSTDEVAGVIGSFLT